MSISQLASTISQSPTLKLNETALLLKQKGEPVIHLGSGEPKTKTPIDAILSASSKLISADIKYTPTDGIPELKKAIIQYTDKNYGKIVSPENVLVSSGAKNSIYNLLITIINPQEEVIILAPYWVSYPEMVKLVYARPVIVTPAEDKGFHPRMKDIEESVSSYTKAIIVNSPNNPSGVMYSEEFIAEIVEFCEKKKIYLIMDDVYHRLVFRGKKAPSCYKFSKDHSDNSKLIVINGISKLYGMTGFRIGWTIANKKIISAMNNVQAQTMSCPSTLSQYAAVGALLGDQSCIDSLCLHLENNCIVMMNELKSFNGVRVVEPDGTFYCFADFRAYSNDSESLSKTLLEKALVVTVPGKEFGVEGHLRLSFCGTEKEIIEGIARMKWVLDVNSPKEIYIGERKFLRDGK